MNKFFRGFQLIGFVLSWAMQAAADKKITIYEVAELLEGIGEIAKIKELKNLEIELPDGSVFHQ